MWAQVQFLPCPCSIFTACLSCSGLTSNNIEREFTSTISHFVLRHHTVHSVALLGRQGPPCFSAAVYRATLHATPGNPHRCALRCAVRPDSLCDFMRLTSTGHGLTPSRSHALLPSAPAQRSYTAYGAPADGGISMCWWWPGTYQPCTKPHSPGPHGRLALSSSLLQHDARPPHVRGQPSSHRTS